MIYLLREIKTDPLPHFCKHNSVNYLFVLKTFLLLLFLRVSTMLGTGNVKINNIAQPPGPYSLMQGEMFSGEAQSSRGG